MRYQDGEEVSPFRDLDQRLITVTGNKRIVQADTVTVLRQELGNVSGGAFPGVVRLRLVGHSNDDDSGILDVGN